MPEKPETEDNDDIRARFANLQRDAESAAPIDDALPPVPQVKIDRPVRPPLPGEPDYGKQGIGAAGRVMGSGMFAGGNTRASGAALTIGTSLVGSIVAGTGLGWLADRYLLHSAGTPWGLIVGFLLGVASGFINLIRVSNQLNKE